MKVIIPFVVGCLSSAASADVGRATITGVLSGGSFDDFGTFHVRNLEGYSFALVIEYDLVKLRPSTSEVYSADGTIIGRHDMLWPLDYTRISDESPLLSATLHINGASLDATYGVRFGSLSITDIFDEADVDGIVDYVSYSDNVEKRDSFGPGRVMLMGLPFNFSRLWADLSVEANASFNPVDGMSFVDPFSIGDVTDAMAVAYGVSEFLLHYEVTSSSPEDLIGTTTHLEGDIRSLTWEILAGTD